MADSHTFAQKPSSLLVLVALGIVARVHRDWIAVDLSQAAETDGVSPQRLSRLVTRAISSFETALGLLTRRGRPRADQAAQQLQTELSLCQALLEVAGEILGRLPLRRRLVGALVVGAWLRLKGTPGMTQQRFCQALSVRPRTLRSWLSHPPRQNERQGPVLRPPPPPPTPRKRGPRRPRFGFDLLLPDTQIAADTTGLSAFGISLKLVAAQDVGGRDQDLLDSVIIDDHESAELVASVLTDALTGAQGAQVIVDQGTPYMAQRTIDALEEIGVEHAPQPEGDPQAKGTIERAFETVKTLAGPLLRITDGIAQRLPLLRDTALAQAAARLVVISILRAYQFGARAATRAIEARGAVDPDELARRAADHRDQARATEISARLLLGHVHDLYDLPGPAKTFVDSLRRYPLEVLHRAERAFRTQVHRDDIRDRKSYFAALVRRFHDDYRQELRRIERETEQHRHLQAQRAEIEAREAARRASPTAFLREALEAIAVMWQPDKGCLLFGGVGLGTGLLSRAIRTLDASLGYRAAVDVACGVFDAFCLDWRDRLGPDGLLAVEQHLSATLSQLQPRSEVAPCEHVNASAILGNDRPKQRPPPSVALRN